MDSEQTEITFIRHGESQYNYKAQILREKLGIGPTWEEYKSNPQFMTFKYSEEMLDCQLSQTGTVQCEKLREQLAEKSFDLVLVSPLFRTLQTCALIFPKEKYEGKVKVTPVLSQSLRCACDVSYRLPKAKELWNWFDFSEVDGRQGIWYIENQQPQLQQTYKKYLEQENSQSYSQNAKLINKYMGQTHIFEDSPRLIERKKLILSHLQTTINTYKPKSLAIVSHFYTISYIVSPTFDSSFKPAQKLHIANATPFLLSYPFEK